MRLGFLADLLSRPVLVGYVAGVAMIMIVDQLPRLTGVRASGSGFFPQLLSAVRHASEAHWPTVVLAAAVLVVLFAAPFLWRTPWPAARPRRRHGCGGRLRARRPVRDYGDRPGSGGPASPELPSIADLSHLLPPALGILLIGYSDVILTGGPSPPTTTPARSTPTASCSPWAPPTSEQASCTASRSAAGPAVQPAPTRRAQAARDTHGPPPWLC